MRERCSILVKGSVQGVGFRPFVYRLAAQHRLGGSVCNGSSGLWVEVEGESAAIQAFCDSLKSAGPPLARVERIRLDPLPVRDEWEFHIRDSRLCDRRTISIPADAPTCEACLAELFDPRDRRYRYPFINCTDCGPRLTIIEDVPYDRVRTTMAGFAMCAACTAEYEDPANRRYHAEPIACPVCGPQVSLRDPAGKVIETGDPVALAAEALAEGRIVAVKGLGGYHLACDAESHEAVERLRRRKRRSAKPLAIMVADAGAAGRLCRTNAAEEKLLAGPQRPIVLLEKRLDSPVAEEVAPGQKHLGIMLAYTPLHHLLLANMDKPLVMTSGNVSDEPIAYRDVDALVRLSSIADLFLTHDRPIAIGCDDSVGRSAAGREVLIRRSRGYVPQAVHVAVRFDEPVLAVGGDLKNTFALVRDGEAFISHHIGDLQDLSTYKALTAAIETYQRLLGIEPALIAHDLHPGYLSTRLAGECAAAERIPVQHHHAHFAGCLAENGVTEPAIGVIFDGTGYGPDGAILGGEFLIGNSDGVERVGYLGYVPLAGGDAAVREPWRSAVCHLAAADAGELAPDLVQRIGYRRWQAVGAMAKSSEMSVPTSSIGRLFDAVAAMTGLCEITSFEAEAAMRLEAAADPGETSQYPVEVREDAGILIWQPQPIVRCVAGDLDRGRPLSEIAGKFHNTLASAVRILCGELRRRHGLHWVALSGGVFQNVLLLERTVSGLSADGFEVLLHRQVPANDGGLCLGQAMVAGAQAGIARG